MIINILLTVIKYFLSMLIWLLPEWDLPPEIFNGINTLYASGLSWNWLFPVETLYQVLTYMIYINLCYLAVKAGAGLLSLLRGGGKLDI